MKTWIAIILALTSLRVFAAEPVVVRDLPYAGSTGDPRTLDIYSPAEGGDHPVVLWIHGGGWQYGDKADLQKGAADPVVRKPHAFVENGLVFVSINYRLIPAATLRQMAGDVARAISWVHGHIRAHGGDPDSIFVMGHSAGAQLAALVCTDGSYLEHEGLSLGAVKGCVPVDGDTYYPELQIDLEPEAATVNSYLLKFPDLVSQKSLSSVLHASEGKSIPPFLLLHVADHPESHTDLQAEILAEALREAGIPVRVLPCPGRTHDTLNADLGLRGDGPTEAIFAFLHEQIKRAG